MRILWKAYRLDFEVGINGGLREEGYVLSMVFLLTAGISGEQWVM